MNSQDIRNLQEAYNQVHQVDENLLRSLDTGARNLAGTIGGNIGAKKGREKMGNLPVLGDIGANQGRTQGTRKGQEMYDKAKETVGGLLKQDYEYDMFDVILEHLIAEGYADTNESALVIMANMSEEWRESIVEAEVLAAKGGVPGTMKVKPTQQGGFLGIGAKTVNIPVAGSFTPKDVSSTDAARFNNRLDRKFGASGGSIDATPAANVQYAANRAGHSGYMKVKDPSSIPDTGIPNRPTPGRASDQNQARTMGSDIVRMNRRK